MKENKLKNFIAVVLLISVIAIILVAGTYAKYTSSAAGSDTVTIAKWDIKAGKAGEEVSITGSDAQVEFNLFDTIRNDDGTVETDVVSSKIAPGTMGEFQLSVKNDSEVNAEYTINFAIDNTNLPLEFKLNDSEWTKSLSNVASTELDMGTSSLATVQWRWAYETLDGNNSPDAGDVVDTGLGLAPEQIKVTATLVVNQAD